MNEPRDLEIRRRLRELPDQTDPPPEVEARILEALRAGGLIAPPAAARRARGRWQLAAACLVGLLGGWLGHALLGAQPAPTPPAGGDYLLLLSEPEPLKTDKPLAELVGEYRAWAGGLAAEGRLVNAARLIHSGRRLRGGVDGRVAASEETNPESATGFFLVRAGSLDEASEIAASCPHLGYGGEISVRALAAPGS